MFAEGGRSPLLRPEGPGFAGRIISLKANSRIAESLYRKAMGDGPQSVTACIFWLKTRARWKENPVEEPNASDYPTVIFRTIVEPPPRDAEGRPMGKPVPVGPPIIEHIPERH